MKTIFWAKTAVTLLGVGCWMGVGDAGAADGGDPAKAAAAEAGVTILDMKSYWRVHATKGPHMVPIELLKETETDATSPQFWVTRYDPCAHGPERTSPEARTVGDEETPPPPKEWMRPDYDDSFWARSAGSFADRRGHAAAWADMGCRRLCLRGRFKVADPAAVKKLILAGEYRGGVVVFLNGQEVLRRHLPGGELGPLALAEPYPREAYVDAAGKVLPGSYFADPRIQKGEQDLAARLKKQDNRILEPVELPLRLLRKGTNLLAVGCYESAFRPEAMKWCGDRRVWDQYPSWPHIGLASLRLAAEGDGLISNVSRPKGLQVWNQDIHRLFGTEAYGDPDEPIRPIRLAGVRNGFYSGQVVVSADAVLADLKAAATGLAQAGGGGKIPASSVRVLYGDLPPSGEYEKLVGGKFFISLNEAPPAEAGNVRPVWVTVRVPGEVPAGMYRGALTISAAGASPVEIPIEVEVIDWALPSHPSDYQGFVGIYQSPESLAIQYNVPMWSEEHWKLVEKSFDLLGYLGNRHLVIPLITQSQFGNDESMVRWIKQTDLPAGAARLPGGGQAQAGGSYKYDFSIYDRYVALAKKHCKISMLSLIVFHAAPAWDPKLGPGGAWNDWGQAGPDKPTFVTLADPATGKTEPMKLPVYGTEECKKLWKALMDELWGRLKKEELDKATVVLGICAEGGVHPDVVNQFKEVFPQAAGWHYGAHGRPHWKGKSLKLGEYMYIPFQLGPPGTGPSGCRPRPYDWWTPEGGQLIVMSERQADVHQTPMVTRTMVERAMLLGDKGAGRMGLDYWPVKGAAGPNFGTSSRLGHFPESSVCQRTPFLHALAFPGKNGPVSTVKIEAMREGCQEAEARAFLELAVVRDKTITGELAEKCRKFLDRKWEFCRIAHRPCEHYAYDEGWQTLSADLYRLAAEVAGKLGGK
ncbi:MAG: glycoside hydrolase domain-containing protein [Planctomycetota bacterium]